MCCVAAPYLARGRARESLAGLLAVHCVVSSAGAHLMAVQPTCQGLQARDLLQEIDSCGIRGLPAAVIQLALRGPVGSRVPCRVQRDGVTCDVLSTRAACGAEIDDWLMASEVLQSEEEEELEALDKARHALAVAVGRAYGNRQHGRQAQPNQMYFKLQDSGCLESPTVLLMLSAELMDLGLSAPIKRAHGYELYLPPEDQIDVSDLSRIRDLQIVRSINHCCASMTALSCRCSSW